MGSTQSTWGVGVGVPTEQELCRRSLRNIQKIGLKQVKCGHKEA